MSRGGFTLIELLVVIASKPTALGQTEQALLR